MFSHVTIACVPWTSTKKMVPSSTVSQQQQYIFNSSISIIKQSHYGIIRCRTISTSFIMISELLLSALGFNEKEVKVIIFLNRMGPSPASVIARHTNINRTTMYDIITSLEKGKLLMSYKQGANTFFALEDVSRFVLLQKERMKAAEELVSELHKDKISHTNLQVTYYKGAEGARQMYLDMLSDLKSELLAWVDLEAFYTLNPSKQDDEWTDTRVQNGIPARLLMQDSEVARQFQSIDKQNIRKTILLPQEYMFHTSCFVYDDHMCFFDLGKEKAGIRIDNPGLVQMQRATFEMAWKLFNRK